MNHRAVTARERTTTETSAPEPSSLVERRVEAFLERVGAALADEACNRGVRDADVIVRVDLADRAGPPLLLLFDRTPAEVKRADEVVRHDVRLTMGTPDLECFFKTGQDLPVRILSGEISFEGCVRKLLRVLPILRAGAQRTAADPQG